MTSSPPSPARPTPAQIREAVDRINEFSPAPRILARAMMLMRDAQCDIDTIAELIRGDPALSADMIRISNSAYFGGSVRVQSVEHALQQLGFRETMRLLNLAVARTVTHQNLDHYCISAEDFWAESLFNGLFMEELARATGGADPAEAYSAGLLRYLGRLAINRAIDCLGGGLNWLGTETLAQWEADHVGLTHSQAGGMLLRRWRFPAVLIAACEGQEQPAVLPTPNWMASALFFISSVLPQDFDQPFHPVLEPTIDTDFTHPNNLTPDSVESIFRDTVDSYEKIRTTFA